MFNGNEIDTTMLRIGTMNMLLHDVENPKSTIWTLFPNPIRKEKNIP